MTKASNFDAGWWQWESAILNHNTATNAVTAKENER